MSPTTSCQPVSRRSRSPTRGASCSVTGTPQAREAVIVSLQLGRTAIDDFERGRGAGHLRRFGDGVVVGTAAPTSADPMAAGNSTATTDGARPPSAVEAKRRPVSIASNRPGVTATGLTTSTGHGVALAAGTLGSEDWAAGTGGSIASTDSAVVVSAIASVVGVLASALAVAASAAVIVLVVVDLPGSDDSRHHWTICGTVERSWPPGGQLGGRRHGDGNRSIMTSRLNANHGEGKACVAD